MAGAWEITSDPERFEEALAWFRQRVPISADDFYKLTAAARDRSFTVSGVTQADVIQQTLSSLEEAAAKGISLQDWRKSFGPTLKAAWKGTVKDPGHRIATIFRTNLQSAYSRGRQIQQDHPVVAQLRPARLFDSVRDGRRTAICASCHGVIALVGDPWLDSHTPPLHHKCRSRLRALRQSQADQRIKDGRSKTPTDLNATTEEEQQPATGFGERPTDLAGQGLRPLWEGYSPEVARIGKAKLSQAKAQQPKATVAAPKPPPPEHTSAHWEAQYQAKGYPAEVTRHLATGRALVEQSKGLSSEERRAAVTHLAGTGSLPWQRQALESLDYLEAHAGRDPGLHHGFHQRRLDTALALSAHAQRVTPQRVELPKWDRAPAQELRKIAEEHRQQVSAILSTYADQSIRHPGAKGTKFKQLKGRAYYQRAYAGKPAALVASPKPGSAIHEWGHALETENPWISEAARAYLAHRTKGQPLQSLRALTGIKYRKSEKARLGGFLNPYWGKDYPTDTEITSMALQQLALDGGAQLLAKDPETYYWILGILAGKR